MISIKKLIIAISLATTLGLIESVYAMDQEQKEKAAFTSEQAKQGACELLFSAVRSGNIEGVKLAISLGADVVKCRMPLDKLLSKD